MVAQVYNGCREVIDNEAERVGGSEWWGDGEDRAIVFKGGRGIGEIKEGRGGL